MLGGASSDLSPSTGGGVVKNQEQGPSGKASLDEADEKIWVTGFLS